MSNSFLGRTVLGGMAVACMTFVGACTTSAKIGDNAGGSGGGAGGSVPATSSTGGAGGHPTQTTLTGHSTTTTSSSTSSHSQQCVTLDDCPCNNLCVGGVCEQRLGGIPSSCTVDLDCGPACLNLQCNNGKCAEKPCTTDSNCPTGQVCELGTGCNAPKACVTGCHTDQQCGTGSKCATMECITCPCPGVCQEASLCVRTGGTESTAMCCTSSGDFPSSCLVGACGCALSNSHSVKTCNCAGSKCYDPVKGCVQ